MSNHEAVKRSREKADNEGYKQKNLKIPKRDEKKIETYVRRLREKFSAEGEK